MERLNLLPYRFKKYAWIGLFSFLVATIIIKISGIDLSEDSKELLKNILQSGILLCLLTLTIAAGKQEDELTIQIRIKAFTNAFIFGVGFTAIVPFANLLFDGEFNLQSRFELLLMMFAVFFISYYSIKKKTE
ncbi:MAG: hypothetical protein KDC84_10605 [Crocinitomicaceae bacterium]|nr:hypothetical protein [Crocinitomicaceae bacterium]